MYDTNLFAWCDKEASAASGFEIAHRGVEVGAVSLKEDIRFNDNLHGAGQRSELLGPCFGATCVWISGRWVLRMGNNEFSRRLASAV